MRILIAYFSRSGNNYVGGRVTNLPAGNTEVAAGIIRKLTGGEMFRIRAAKEYPADYEETTVVAKEEMRQRARPALSTLVDAMNDYDVVCLGYPNWWGTMPMVVFTFLEQHDFTGKTIVPFCTHEGSGMGRSESDIKKLSPGAEVRKGLPIRGEGVQEAETEIATWLRESRLID